MSVTTTKRINLSQLSSETGWALQSSQDGETLILSVMDAEVSNADLQAAIDAHVATDEVANRTTLEQQASNAVQGNRLYLSRNNPTVSQNTAQIKALTQQMNGVIRLILQRFESTD